MHGASRVFGVFAADGTLVSERVVHGVSRVLVYLPQTALQCLNV